MLEVFAICGVWSPHCGAGLVRWAKALVRCQTPIKGQRQAAHEPSLFICILYFCHTWAPTQRLEAIRPKTNKCYKTFTLEDGVIVDTEEEADSHLRIQPCRK